MNTSKRPMINQALKLVRLYWGLSQKDLADELGLSQSMISEIERGSKSVSMEVLERYSDKLKIRMSQLMLFAEKLDDEPVKNKGKLIVAGSILNLLEAMAPKEPLNEQLN